MWLFVVGGLVMVDYSCIVVEGLVIVELRIRFGIWNIDPKVNQ